MHREFKIKVKSEIISVTEEIYTTYYKMGRRERYLEEVAIRKNLSYNQLIEQGYPVEESMRNPQPLVDEIITNKIMINNLLVSLEQLPEKDRFIINELFYKGISERELAQLMMIPRTTLQSRKHNIIKKLKRIIDK